MTDAAVVISSSILSLLHVDSLPGCPALTFSFWKLLFLLQKCQYLTSQEAVPSSPWGMERSEFPLYLELTEYPPGLALQALCSISSAPLSQAGTVLTLFQLRGAAVTGSQQQAVSEGLVSEPRPRPQAPHSEPPG